MRVIGISPAHDSSVCVYEDGKIISFLKEERFSRIKKDKSPIISLQKTFENIKNVDAFAFCSVENADLFNYFESLVSKFSSFQHSIDLSDLHHLQHASLSFYNSGFQEAAAIVIDRNGSIFLNSARESESIFYCSYPYNFIPVYKNFWIGNNLIHDKLKNFDNINNTEIEANSMHGIVKVYESATSLIRQNPLENGKTMGLAAYGKENKNFPPLFFNKTNIPIDAIFEHEDFGYGQCSCNKVMKEMSTDDINIHNYQPYADYAYHVQKETQDAVAYLVEKAISKTKTKNIVLSGGYALNVVCNHYFIKKFPDVNFYFEPIADDSGNSIGGAMLFYRMLTEDNNVYDQSDTFIHGKKYDLSSINGKNVSINTIAKKLSEGKSIAIYEGLAEAGPRALGHRSILYYPSDKNSKDTVNKIKKREWYRPFAAAVLEEDAPKYFNMSGIPSSPYMTISFPANDFTKKLFPGIVHVDGSCRIQTVNSSNKTMFSLLNELKKITEHGILLNTSFNLAGEPLVETPEEALETLQKSDLNYIWFPEIGKIVE